MTDGADGSDMLALVRQIHDGVYDYQKHQDDRVGRFLTALAFLGSGALVVALGGTVRNVRYSFVLGLVLAGYGFAANNPRLAGSDGAVVSWSVGPALLMFGVLALFTAAETYEAYRLREMYRWVSSDRRSGFRTEVRVIRRL